MDSQEEEREMGITDFVVILLRLGLALLFLVFVIALSSSVLMVGIAVFYGHLSIRAPTSLPSQCKIVSSTVDLRSSKVCELGLLNYKAKTVLYPFDRRKFRCRYDYYWASVFEVEYKDHSLGKMRLGVAEAPDEALPLNCRPNFGIAWLTKDRFKVNRTYDCWYSSSISKVSLYEDGFFNCQAKDLSLAEMIRRFFTLSPEILRAILVRPDGKASYWRWDTVAGVVSGFLTSLVTVSFLSILRRVKSLLCRTWIGRMVARFNLVLFKRTFFTVASVADPALDVWGARSVMNLRFVFRGFGSSAPEKNFF